VRSGASFPQPLASSQGDQHLLIARLYVWDSHLSDDAFSRVSSELNQYLATGILECSPCPYTEYAFEITAIKDINEVFAGFSELQFYDCTGTQLVPSAWSNPDGNQDGYNNPPAFAFDGDLGTKWLDRNKQLLIATFSTVVRVASYKCIILCHFLVSFLGPVLRWSWHYTAGMAPEERAALLAHFYLARTIAKYLILLFMQ
jgi:hypothetical protein